MIEIFAILLVVMWAIFVLTANTLGGSIHVLLLIAAVMLVIRFVRGRSVVSPLNKSLPGLFRLR